MTKRIDYNQHGFEDVNVSDPETVLKLQNALSVKIFSITEFTSGALNKVYRLTGEDRDLVTKISPEWNIGGLDRERWCYELIRKMASLRISELVAYLSASNDIFPGHEILTMEYIPGSNLSQVDMMTRSTHVSISGILEQLHSIRSIDGYGWLNSAFTGEHENWRAFLDDLDNVDIVIESGLVSRADVGWVMEQLDREAPETPQTSLLFGDLNRGNLIVSEEDPGLIVPVDFQNCFVGDPLYDIGIGLFFNPEIYEYLDIYLPDESPVIRKRVILYALRHSLSALGHRILVGDQESAKIAVDRFEKLKTTYLSLA